MLNRFAAAAAVSLLLPLSMAAGAAADPEPGPPAVPAADATPPPPDSGAIPAAAAGYLAAPDGLNLTVAGKDETLLPVAPLTTALSSREYLVGGTFTGSVTGTAKLTGGTLEAGYRIGCGIMADTVDINATAGITPSIRIPFTGDTAAAGASAVGLARVHLKPGVVNIVPVTKSPYKGSNSRVTISGFRIKIDSCAGQSFIQSYATLTASTDASDDIITYLGVVKVV